MANASLYEFAENHCTSDTVDSYLSNRYSTGMSEYEQLSKHFPANLLKYRKLRRKSQSWLAKQLCITQGGVSQMERGERMPSVEQAIRISKALRVRVDNLFKEPKKDKRQCATEAILSILSTPTDKTTSSGGSRDSLI
jgi:transcriptional regulator with XRE-family HTH domain